MAKPPPYPPRASKAGYALKNALPKMAGKAIAKKGDEPVRVATKRKPPAASVNPSKAPWGTKNRNDEIKDALKEGYKKYGKTNLNKTWKINYNAGGFGIPRPVPKSSEPKPPTSNTKYPSTSSHKQLAPRPKQGSKAALLPYQGPKRNSKRK